MEAYNIKRNRDNIKQKFPPFSTTKSEQNPTLSSNQLIGASDFANHSQTSPVDMQLGETGEAALIRRIKKRDLHSFLKCPLCTGFFRDAHTINECLDTFCKSCIYKYFYEDQNRETCPKCNTHLGGRPLETIISDQTIQKIVDLLYPQFKEKDAQAIKTMYKAFQDTNPLPRDRNRNLIDYGIEDDDLIKE